jgi:hypothetical protein
MFDSSMALDENSLKEKHPTFWARHHKAVLSHARGFGFWIWKPYLLMEELNQLPDGWGLVYLDAGCILNPTEKALHRLDLYKEYALENSIWATELLPKRGESFLNRDWCKADTLNFLGADQRIKEKPQVQAGILLLKNDEICRSLVTRWYEACYQDSYHYLDDSPSVLPNASSFCEHRHDQSIFSILFRQLNLKPVPDETFFPGRWDTEGSGYPIWSPRWTYLVKFNPRASNRLFVRMEYAWRMGYKKAIILVLLKFLKHTKKILVSLSFFIRPKK